MYQNPIKPVNPKGNQPSIFFRRTDTEAEAPIPWPPDAKSRLVGKDFDAWKDWGQEEKGGNYRGWGGWMASSTQWTGVWASSRRWRKTREPGILQSMGLQRVEREWATEQQLYIKTSIISIYKQYFYNYWCIFTFFGIKSWRSACVWHSHISSAEESHVAHGCYVGHNRKGKHHTIKFSANCLLQW